MERTARFFLLLHRFDDRSATGAVAVREPGALPNELCRDSILRTVGDNWFFVVVGMNHGGSGLCFVRWTRGGQPDDCSPRTGRGTSTQPRAVCCCTESHVLQAGGENDKGDARPDVLVRCREEINEPAMTAGTLPMIIDVVTENSIWPKASAPSAAATVSGTAWVRSVPTSWLATT